MSYKICDNVFKRFCTVNSAADNLKDVLRLILCKRLIIVNLYISESLNTYYLYILSEKSSYVRNAE